MLDALEGAEARARGSEQRLRAFVADAAHELRTPVTGIRAMAEAVLHQPPDADPEERQRMHLLLVREAQRTGRLVEDLLDMARIDAGLPLETRHVDLYDLAAAHLDRTRLLHPDIDFRLTGAPAGALADPERITQILVNLTDNACQALRQERYAMADNGDRRGTITVTVGTTGDVAELSVADNGPGVPPEARERIFDRLVRLDAARERRPQGSGLGLAIARGIARAHGGDLVCTAPPEGRGAVFTLRLKIA
jgi:signal transduction histidine kinase